MDDESLSIYDEIEIEDMTFDEAQQLYHYPCPCGDRFQIAIDDLRDEQDIAVCPSCSLMIRVIFDLVRFPRLLSCMTQLTRNRMICRNLLRLPIASPSPLLPKGATRASVTKEIKTKELCTASDSVTIKHHNKPLQQRRRITTLHATRCAATRRMRLSLRPQAAVDTAQCM